MSQKYTIIATDKADWGIIGGGISDYNTQQAGPENGESVYFHLCDEDGTVIGGITGQTHWGWLYISLLWLPEELRGQGYGHQLLTLAEEKGRECGAKHAYLDTFSFQALNFYKAHGYEVFGELPDFPVGHQRYYMKKEL